MGGIVCCARNGDYAAAVMSCTSTLEALCAQTAGCSPYVDLTTDPCEVSRRLGLLGRVIIKDAFPEYVCCSIEHLTKQLADHYLNNRSSVDSSFSGRGDGRFSAKYLLERPFENKALQQV